MKWKFFLIGLLFAGLANADQFSYSRSVADEDGVRHMQVAQSTLQTHINRICSDPNLSTALYSWCRRNGAEVPGDGEPTDPTDPTDPGEPTDPTDPGEPTDPDEPTDPGDDVDIPPEPGDDQDLPDDVNQQEANVISLVNDVRRAQGLPALEFNELLHEAARNHSQDMASGNFMSHTGSDGSNPGQRISRTGYDWRTYGENVAVGQSSAEEVMDAWMNSSGHRANILSASFCEIGVGYVNRSSGMRHYWTQVFACR